VEIVCILFIYNLCKGYNQGTKSIILSTADGFYTVMDEPDFLNHVPWIDKAGFMRVGVMNLHNLHVWAEENPHPTRSSSFQHRFSVNVWAGIVDDHLIGLYTTEDCIGGAQYLHFLQETLPI
jgi:hypothetical protein